MVSKAALIPKMVNSHYIWSYSMATSFICMTITTQFIYFWNMVIYIAQLMLLILTQIYTTNKNLWKLDNLCDLFVDSVRICYELKAVTILCVCVCMWQRGRVCARVHACMSLRKRQRLEWNGRPIVCVSP